MELKILLWGLELSSSFETLVYVKDVSTNLDFSDR